MVQEKGQDWTYDELTEVYQVVEVRGDRTPVLSLDYSINHLSSIGGGYIRLHAYRNDRHRGTMIFYFGHDGNGSSLRRVGRVFNLTATGEGDTLSKFEKLIRNKRVMFWELNQSIDRWHHLKVDVKDLYRQASRLAGENQALKADKLFISLGVWNGIEPESKTEVFFDNVNVQWKRQSILSTHNRKELSVTRDVYKPRFIGQQHSSQTLRQSALLINHDSAYDSKAHALETRAQPTSRGVRSDDILWEGRQDDLVTGHHIKRHQKRLQSGDRLVGYDGHDALIGGDRDDWAMGYGQHGDGDRLSNQLDTNWVGTGSSGADAFEVGDNTCVFHQAGEWTAIKNFAPKNLAPTLPGVIERHGASLNHRSRQDNQAGIGVTDPLVYSDSVPIGGVEDTTIG